MRQTHDRQEHSSFPVLESSSREEAGELAEEPNQRRLRIAQALVLRHEKIRLVALCAGAILMIAASVLFLATKTILPLFVTIVLVYPLYRLLDRYLENSEGAWLEERERL